MQRRGFSSLVSRALQAERLLTSMSPSSALPWDMPQRLIFPLDYDGLLTDLCAGRLHAEAGTLLLASHEFGMVINIGTVKNLLASAARSNGAVLTPAQVATVVGLGRTTLPDATIFAMLEGHCTHGNYAEALKLSAELARVKSPLSARAQELVLLAGASRRQPLGEQPPGSGGDGAGSLAELAVRALMDPALEPAKAQVCSTTLADLMRLPYALHNAELARVLWTACATLQASAAAAAAGAGAARAALAAPLAPSLYTFLLSAALVSGDLTTLRAVLAHCGPAQHSGRGVTAPESLSKPLLLRCAAATAAAAQWQDTLDILQLMGVGAAGSSSSAQMFGSVGLEARLAALAAAAPPSSPSAAPSLQSCPLWRLLFTQGSDPSLPALGAGVDFALPPSVMDGIPQELLQQELTIQALSSLGRHAEALAAWESGDVLRRLLEHLGSQVPAAASEGVGSGGESLPYIVASHLALGQHSALAPVMDALMQQGSLSLAARPALVKAYADWLVAAAPSPSTSDTLMRQLISACPVDASRTVTAHLLDAALKLHAPAAGPLLVPSGRLSGAWAEEAEGSGTLDLHFSLQAAALALEKTRWSGFLALLRTMHARGFVLPEDAPHAASLHALQLQASVWDSAEELERAVAAWLAAHPLHTCISHLAAALSVLQGVSRCAEVLGPALPGGAAASGQVGQASASMDSPTPAFVYRALLVVAESLADAVAASLGAASAQPLTPLEQSLRLVTLDLLAVARTCQHQALLLECREGASSSLLQRMLSCTLQPLSRQPKAVFAEQDSSSRRVAHDLLTRGVEGLSTSPFPLLYAAGNVLQLLVQVARDKPAVVECWSSKDIERYLLAVQHVSSEHLWKNPTVPRTLTALLDFHAWQSSSSSSGSSTPALLHPLNVSTPAMSALLTHLASTGAVWTLARVLSAVSLPEAPAISSTVLLGEDEGGSDPSPNGAYEALLLASAGTASAIHVPEHVAKAAVIANTCVHLESSTRSHKFDPPFLAATLMQWLRMVGGHSSSRDARKASSSVPWTALLQKDALDTGMPGIVLNQHGRVVRILPPALSADTLPAHARDKFLGLGFDAGLSPDESAASAALEPQSQAAAEAESHRSGTSVFGDAVITLTHAAGGSQAVTLSSPSLARLLRAARSGGPASNSSLPILCRELLRLGVWLEGGALEVVAEAAAQKPLLLVPLLQHLRAQAVCALQVLPGLGKESPLLPALLPHIPICGLGVSPVVRAHLVTAAVGSGSLRLALELLQDGQQHRQITPLTGKRLLDLAAEEPAVLLRLSALLPSAAAAQPPPLAAAKPPPPPPHQSNFFTDRLEVLTATWLSGSSARL